jgi:hypothetical protein
MFKPKLAGQVSGLARWGFRRNPASAAFPAVKASGMMAKSRTRPPLRGQHRIHRNAADRISHCVRADSPKTPCQGFKRNLPQQPCGCQESFYVEGKGRKNNGVLTHSS